MPDGNGFDVLKGVQEKDFEIIFITAYQEYAIQAIKFSALAYILKPIDIDELEEAVDKDNIDGFKAKASTSLQNAMERVEEEFAKHPKRPILIEHITILKESIQSAETITDPREFFSTIYAIMRTTR